MFNKIAHVVMAGLVLCLLAVPVFADSTVFTYNWDFNAASTGLFSNPNPNNPASPDWRITKVGGSGGLEIRPFTGATGDFPGAGVTDGILTPFGDGTAAGSGVIQNGYGINVAVGADGQAFNFVNITFQLWVINTWDGSDTTSGLGPDYFQVGIGSTSSSRLTGNCDGETGTVFCETFAVGPKSQSFAGTATYDGFEASGPVAQGTAPNGFSSVYAGSGYKVYDITLLNIAVTPDPVTGRINIFFRGRQNQGSADENWTISSLSITGTTDETDPGPGPGPGPGPSEIPEPSTVVLGGLGLGLLALAKLRKKTA